MNVSKKKNNRTINFPDKGDAQNFLGGGKPLLVQTTEFCSESGS